MLKGETMFQFLHAFINVIPMHVSALHTQAVHHLSQARPMRGGCGG
jgi:hypothetical protein